MCFHLGVVSRARGDLESAGRCAVGLSWTLVVGLGR